MLKVLEITDYAYTAEYTNGNASVGVFTYAKQIGSITVKPNETYTPSYSQSVKANIKSYASHDETIAKVNSNDGTITAISAGHTYIDIVTDQGTAGKHGNEGCGHIRRMRISRCPIFLPQIQRNLRNLSN